MKTIEEKIRKIQKSTKTLMPFFASLHDDLRQTFNWYYQWHLFQFAGLSHLIILIIFLGLIVIFSLKF